MSPLEAANPFQEITDRLRSWFHRLRTPGKRQRIDWGGLLTFIAKIWGAAGSFLIAYMALFCAYGFTYRSQYRILLSLSPKPDDFHVDHAFVAGANALSYHSYSFSAAILEASAPYLQTFAVVLLIYVLLIPYAVFRNFVRWLLNLRSPVTVLFLRSMIILVTLWIVGVVAPTAISEAVADAEHDTRSYVEGHAQTTYALPLHFRPLDVTFTADAQRRLPPELVAAAQRHSLLLVDEDETSISVVIRNHGGDSAHYPMAHVILKSALLAY